MASLSGLYFDGGDESAGERSMVIVMFFVYLFVAMMVLVVDEDTLETGLDDAYETFNRDESSKIKFVSDMLPLAAVSGHLVSHPVCL